MANLDDTLQNDTLLKILVYGEAKTKKTWWAGTAAEAGFNVIMLSLEKGHPILRNLSQEARKRVTIVDLGERPKISPVFGAVGATFMTHFCKGEPFAWDEKTKQMVPFFNAKNREHELLNFDTSKLTSNDVVILDTYTALVYSLNLQFALENKIDLSDAKKIEWEGYRWSGAFLDWVLERLRALPCHVIVVAHVKVYEKKKTQLVNGKREQITESTRVQPVSCSGPHGMTIAGEFDDVLYFVAKGESVKIDTRKIAERDGGGRTIPPAIYSWEELQFKDVCKRAGIALPNLQAPQAQPVTQKQEVSTSQSQTLNAATSGKSLNSMFDKL